MLTTSRLKKIDDLVRKLSSEDDEWVSLAVAVDLADEIMLTLLPENSEWSAQLTRNVVHTGSLPNPLPRDIFKNQKQITWFREHPEVTSARSAFNLFYADDAAIESKFFWFSESATKQKISAATEYSPNWEDSDLTRLPKYKVGVDFFLSKDTNSLLMVISNRQRLRVLELSGHLSNTQKQIFKNNLNGAAAYSGFDNLDTSDLEPQRTIHESLWNALQLREVNKKFYQIVASHFEELVDKLHRDGKTLEDAKQFSSRLLGRLLFVWFLRKMDVINEQVGYFDVENQNADEYYETHIKVLFFKTLNTEIKNREHSDDITPYLNGGLFDAKENDFVNETLGFPDGYFMRLFSHFDEFNFTTDESSADFELIAVDPEMLGQVFESLLASQTDDDGGNQRKKTGAFYTPREVVAYMVKKVLREYLYSKVDKGFHDGIDTLLDSSDAQWLARKSTSKVDVWGVNSKIAISKIREALDNFKVLDPAVGSGAFPMGMLQLLLKTYERIDTRFDPYKLKLSIIENSIFGVDIQPMAIEIARLRAWLSVIVDEQDRTNIQPLPNLDFKFVSADSLRPLDNTVGFNSEDKNLDLKLAGLRDRYFNARSSNGKNAIQNEYYDLTSTSLLFEDSRTTQLKSFNPFTNRNAATFFDGGYIFGVNKFDAVIGNPPYVDYRKIGNDYYKNNYQVAKTSKMINLYNYFFEMANNVVKEDGIVAFITPQQYLAYDNTKGVRDIIRKHRVVSLSDFSNVKVFDASTYTFVTILRMDAYEPQNGVYQEFNEIDQMKPMLDLPVENPLPEPVIFTKYQKLLNKIQAKSDKNLGDFAKDIFVASSATQTKLDIDEGDYQYIEASQVYPYQFKNVVASIDFTNKYSKQSLKKQLGSIVYTSRMTERIRANFVENSNGKFLGGKVNVIIADHPRYVQAILNSNVINFWFLEANRLVHMSGGALPINAADLKKIPISTDVSFMERVEGLVGGADLESKNSIDDLIRNVDNILYEYYGFDENDVATLEDYFEI